MLVLVTYDISTIGTEGGYRLTRIAKTCTNYGIRVQNSVFECKVDPAQWEMLKSELLRIFNKDEDSLRFYFLGSNWKRRVEHHGIKESFDFDSPIIL
ncbi:MAG: CRISPR-associated endonuclease Cas2 [Spirochaetes bacterium]|jgi:CRISPR-associated protein Cas2|nr:CRISPR-associated endonuclease Cas2 [Spirochaetota bacterium]